MAGGRGQLRCCEDESPKSHDGSSVIYDRRQPASNSTIPLAHFGSDHQEQRRQNGTGSGYLLVVRIQRPLKSSAAIF